MFILGKELNVREIYGKIKTKVKDSSFPRFQQHFEELYEALRRADILLLKDKSVSIKYPWEDLLK